jgi:hypothetical protein
MAYTQKPGRGNSSKTGSGIPSALLQEKPKSKSGETKQEGLNNLNATSSNNKDRVRIEAMAKNDSVSAASSRRMTGGNKFQQGLQGNLAANKRRESEGAGDMKVNRGTAYANDSGYGDNPNSGGKKTTYTRNSPVEKEYKAKDMKAYASGKGKLDPADEGTIKTIGKALSMKSPAKQMKKKIMTPAKMKKC